jgi:hypothetical protein
MLAEELPDARFVEARNIWEWRVRPARLNRIAADFVAACHASEQRTGSIPG